MLFYTTRLALWITVACLLFVLIRRFVVKRKRLAYILAFFAAAALTGISVVYPVENLVLRFNSAESVFSYIGKGKVQTVLEGQESCMVIYSQQGKTDGQLLIPKKEKCYLIPKPTTTVKVASSDADQAVFYDVYSAQGTEDYYVFGYLVSDASDIDITDNAGKSLQMDARPSVNPKIKYVTFYGVIEDYGTDYFITVNGEHIPAV